MAFEKKRIISALVLKDLEARGAIIRTNDDSLYFFEREKKTLFALSSEDFRSPLAARFDLNSTEDESRFVERAIATHGMTAGQQAAVHRLTFWDRLTRTLYVFLGNGIMAKFDGESITTIDNGVDGVLFLNDKTFEPVTPTTSHGTNPFHEVFGGLNLAGDEQQQRHMLALLKVWLLSVFFLHALPVRPIVGLIGEQGSGKTTLGRRLGLVINGPRFDVGSFRSDTTGEQDFLASITSRRFAVFDNADARITWLADHLAKLSTGAEIQRRRLYTTNDLVTFKPDCFLMLTSRDPRWKRDDVSKRLLPIRMDTIAGAKVPEGRLQQHIIERRPEIWGALFNMLNTIVAALRVDDGSFTSKHRLADFHWFGRLAASALDVAGDFEDAMTSLDETQTDLLADGDERLDLFQAWLDTKPDDWEETLTSAEIHTALRKLHIGNDRDYPFRNATALGTWLGRHKEMVAHKLKVVVTPKRSTVTRSWSFEKARCHGGGNEEYATKRTVTSHDTLTPYSDSKTSGDEETGMTEDLELFEEEPHAH
jgi:hypothetical protein